MVTTFERSWPDVLIGPISVSNHIVTLPNVNGLHTKQKITLQLGAQTQDFEIKRILSPTTIKVGPLDSNLFTFSNPVSFSGGILWASEQPRNTIAVDPIIRNVYEEEPAVAIRAVNVDRYGQFYSASNPLPVAATLLRPNKQTIVNELAALADTEYSFVFPDTTSSYRMRVRDGNAFIKIAFTPGTTGTLYKTVEYGEEFQVNSIMKPLSGPLVVYYRVSKPNKIIEIYYEEVT